MTPVSAFSRSFSSATAQKGDAIIVPRVSVMSTTTFNYDNNSGFPYEGSGGEVVAITLNIDKHQIVPCDVTDIQSANSSVADVTVFARQQGAALARKCITDIFGLLSIANYGAAVATAVSIADTGVSQLRTARTTLVGRQVPMENLSLIASAELFNSLLGDANVTNAMNFGGSEAIREGRIPRLLGMDIYETNALPLGGTLSLIGFVAHQDALGLAVRTLMPQSSAPYEAVEVVTGGGAPAGFASRVLPGLSASAPQRLSDPWNRTRRCL
jgi:hypothetical protein